MAPKHRLHRSYRTRIFVVAGSVFIVVLAGALLSRSVWQDKTVATNATASPTPSPTPAKTQTPTPTDTPTPSAPKSQVDKVVVIMLENKSSTQIRTEAPRLTALGDRFGKAPRALAPCDHPSQPNYVCLSTGGRYVSSNSIKTLSNPDLWNNTLASGRTMKVYADSLPADVRDRRKNVGKYAARHVFTVPFVATTAKAANFSRYTVNAETLATDVAKEHCRTSVRSFQTTATTPTTDAQARDRRRSSKQTTGSPTRSSSCNLAQTGRAVGCSSS